MSCCYTTRLEMKSKDEAKTIAAAKEFIRANPCGANFCLEGYAKDGIDVETLDGLVSVMLAGWSGQRVRKETLENGFTSYWNEFNASCGWLRVLEAWFDAVGPTLEDGSEFQVDAEKQWEEWTVVNGEVV